MTTKPLAGQATRGQEMADALKQWVMAALTFIFVALYGAALGGLLRPLADEKVVTRLEPIIFVIIGYYFGRLPGQQNEKTLKEEVTRQTQKADATQHAKEQAQQMCEALEEKVKNAKTVLTAGAPPKGQPHDLEGSAAGRDEALSVAVIGAVGILSS